MIETYSDLWKSDEERTEMLEFGVASEGVRKIWAGDDSAPTTGDDVTMASDTKLAVPLTKVFGGSGPICSYHMKEIEFVFKLPASEELMVAQSGEAKGKYRLTNIDLEFETVIWGGMKFHEILLICIGEEGISILTIENGCLLKFGKKIIRLRKLR